jgi:hypothetical protein
LPRFKLYLRLVEKELQRKYMAIATIITKVGIRTAIRIIDNYDIEEVFCYSILRTTVELSEGTTSDILLTTGGSSTK